MPEPNQKYQVEEWTSEINGDDRQHYWEYCPHGCPDNECEGHYGEEDRICAVTNLFDRYDGDGCGWFSPARAALIAEFMNKQEAPDA